MMGRLHLMVQEVFQIFIKKKKQIKLKEILCVKGASYIFIKWRKNDLIQFGELYPSYGSSATSDIRMHQPVNL